MIMKSASNGRKLHTFTAHECKSGPSRYTIPLIKWLSSKKAEKHVDAGTSCKHDRWTKESNTKTIRITAHNVL